MDHPYGNYKNGKYTWAEMKVTGDELFDCIERPHLVPDFKLFADEGDRVRNLHEVPPFLHRVRLLMTHDATKDAFTTLRASLGTGIAPPPECRTVLIELAALYVATNPDGLCPVPLRALLAQGKTSRERARGRTEASLSEATVESIISLSLRDRAPTYPWYTMHR